jgi:hypothetical protein
VSDITYPVKMRHPDIDEYPEEAFPSGYPVAINEEQLRGMEANGWERVPDDEEDLNSLSMTDLRARVEAVKAEGRDINPAGRKKADLVKALEKDRAATRAERPEQFQGP